MTIQTVINFLGSHQQGTFIYFISLIILSLIAVNIVKSSNFKYLKYLFCILVYAVTVPGVLSTFISLYLVLFFKVSILELDLLTYLLPSFTMVVCLAMITKKINLNRIPGFGKLSSLILIIVITFIIIFVLQKTFFGLVFLGSFTQLILTFVVIFVIVKIAWDRLIK